MRRERCFALVFFAQLGKAGRHEQTSISVDRRLYRPRAVKKTTKKKRERRTGGISISLHINARQSGKNSKATKGESDYCCLSWTLEKASGQEVLFT